MANKQLQYTYCPMSHEVRQPDNEIGSVNSYIL